MSAIQGSYTPEQTFLDMSAGARTTTSLYDGEVPTGIAARAGTARDIARWQAIAERARRPRRPTSCPGLLASSVRDGRRARRLRGPADVAQPGGGRRRRPRGPRRARGARAAPARSRDAALALWRDTDLLVVKLPPGPPGRRAARASCSRRAGPRTWCSWSRTRATSRAGCVAAAPPACEGGTTLLLGLDPHRGPRQLHRRRADRARAARRRRSPTTCRASRSRRAATRAPADLSELRNRLTDLGPRRWAVIWLGLIGARR